MKISAGNSMPTYMLWFTEIFIRFHIYKSMPFKTSNESTILRLTGLSLSHKGAPPRMYSKIHRSETVFKDIYTFSFNSINIKFIPNLKCVIDEKDFIQLRLQCVTRNFDEWPRRLLLAKVKIFVSVFNAVWNISYGSKNLDRFVVPLVKGFVKLQVFELIHCCAILVEVWWTSFEPFQPCLYPVSSTVTKHKYYTQTVVSYKLVTWSVWTLDPVMQSTG